MRRGVGGSMSTFLHATHSHAERQRESGGSARCAAFVFTPAKARGDATASAVVLESDETFSVPPGKGVARCSRSGELIARPRVQCIEGRAMILRDQLAVALAERDLAHSCGDRSRFA